MKWVALATLILLILSHSGMGKGNFHYYSYEEMENLLENLKEEHAGIMDFYSIGVTYGKRDIWAVKISDNVSLDENEAEVLFLAAHHGNEKLGYQFILSFIEYLCKNYESNGSVADIINNAEIFFIPMVNPDGVENNTRKNMEPNNVMLEEIFPIIRGVNLNRNYDAGWNEWRPWDFVTTTSMPYGDLFLQILGYPPEYRGEGPFSENESRAVRDFVEERNFIMAADYHTGAGKVIFYPFGYTDEPARDEATFISIAENMSRINGCSFREAGIGVTGMAIDWMYESKGIYALIVEISGDVAPLDKEVVNEIIAENIPAAIYFVERAIEMEGENEYC
ncbi:MAG: hypothetical protein J7L31_05800 [Thermoplasmata archaeon]|nr:hypothetical protein [Thermoplasmata archaeon]